MFLKYLRMCGHGLNKKNKCRTGPFYSYLKLLENVYIYIEKKKLNKLFHFCAET